MEAYYGHLSVTGIDKSRVIAIDFASANSETASRIANTVAETLRARGTGEPAATLAAQSGATVFGIAFAQWIREGETRSLPDIASDVLDELVNLTGTATGSPKLP